MLPLQPNFETLSKNSTVQESKNLRIITVTLLIPKNSKNQR